MHQDVLFISDLHIGLEKPEITRRFLDFLKKKSLQSSLTLYIGRSI